MKTISKLNSSDCTTWLPSAGVTGIGSMPHMNPVAAISLIAQYCPELPFWPQLPQRSSQEYMLLQLLTPLRDLVRQESPARINIQPGQLDAFRRRLATADASFNNATAAGFYAFERACHDGLFLEARAFKGQISGPLTLGRCLYTAPGAGGRPLIHSPELMDELTAYICRLAVWQVERLARFGKPVLLFVDEPTLALEFGGSQKLAYVQCVLGSVRSAGATVGVHCCALGAAAPLFAAAPDIISFDAYHELELFAATPQMASFIRQGGFLALGLIPTLSEPETFSPDAAFARWLAAFVSLDLDPYQVARQTLITATCGLGLVSPNAAQESFLHAQRLSQLLNRQTESASL